MTVNDWRNKRRNRRCVFCKYRTAYSGVWGYCKAKKRNIRNKLLRPFCNTFRVIDEFDNEK